MTPLLSRWFSATLLYVMLLTGSAMAQVSFEVGARGGFGINGANINGRTDTASQTLLFTPSIDFAAELGFEQKVFLQAEVGFTQKGWRLGQDETLLGNNFYVERLNYLTIPVLLEYAISQQENQTITLYAGPSFNTLRKATEKIDLLGVQEEIEHDLDDPNTLYDRSDIAFIVGLGGKARLGRGNFVTDIRISSGTSPYKELTEGGNTLSFTAWTLNFSFGYMFSLTQ